jgi:uncharacterized RDD family membrane protein YckC
VSERDAARALQGTRAGFVSRVVAGTLDVGIVFLLLLGGEALFAAVRAVFGSAPFEFPDAGTAWNSGMLVALLIVVLTLAWSGSGRTLGDSVVGLRVVREEGAHLTWRRAFVRAVIVVLFHVIAMGWILVSRKNAGLHDLACHTAVIYDWRARGHHEDERVPARSETRRTR